VLLISGLGGVGASWGSQTARFAERFQTSYSLFLFGPRFTREHPEAVEAWIEHAAAMPVHPDDRAIGLLRIDMIAAHDTFARLPEITVPTLVLCGRNNACTPLPLSEELAEGIAGAWLTVFEEAGELIELEQPERFFAEVSAFLEGTWKSR
jgi:aminoacrylate hydrolase